MAEREAMKNVVTTTTKQFEKRKMKIENKFYKMRRKAMRCDSKMRKKRKQK